MRSDSPQGDDEVQVSDLWLNRQPHLGYPLARLIELFSGSLPEAPAAIIDVGCGFGHAACEFALKFKESQVLGVDIDSKLVDVAYSRARSLGVNQHCRFCVMDARRQPGALRRRFDLILMLAVQQVYGTAGNAVRWIQSMVNPGGNAIIDLAILVHEDASAIVPCMEEFDHELTSCGASIISRDTFRWRIDRERSLNHLFSQLQRIESISSNTALPQNVIEQKLRSQIGVLSRVNGTEVLRHAVLLGC